MVHLPLKKETFFLDKIKYPACPEKQNNMSVLSHPSLSIGSNTIFKKKEDKWTVFFLSLKWAEGGGASELRENVP